MFDPTDPRARLAPQPAAAPTGAAHYAGSQYVRFHEVAAAGGSSDRSWWMRAQNMVLCYSEVSDEAKFVRFDQPDEWMLLLPDRATSATISAGPQTVSVAGHRLIVMPPGNSEVRISGSGPVLRLFTTRSEDLARLAVNADSYREPRPGVRALGEWPAPPGGYRIRPYDLDVPPQQGRFGRIWRCSTMMVNYLEPTVGPRDPKTASPHSHPDFEQITFALTGEHVHHIRWPWGTDLSAWRDDEHEWCPSPSAAVIPPPSIHTSLAVGSQVNQLIDLFCPPRVDFSEQPGWVLNAEDYPASIGSQT
jgi:hypothetical protein